MKIEHTIGVVIILLLALDVYFQWRMLNVLQVQPGRW